MRTAVCSEAPARSSARAQAAHLADCAVRALREEALLSPKPALVDARGSGAHADLDLARMLRSANSLRGPFADMALAACTARPDAALRTRLAAIGRVAEQRMLLATQGSNAHRGAIWALGLLLGARAQLGDGAAAAQVCETAACIARHEDAAQGALPDAGLRRRLAAIGRVAEQRMLLATQGSNAHRGAIWALGLLLGARAQLGAAADAAEVCATAARIARHPDAHGPDASASHGARAVRRYGVAGARGQACSGFPHVLRWGLPMLRRRLAAGARPEHARLDALLAIMAELDDTCLLHRGGVAALRAAQHGARRVLALGGSAEPAGHAALLALDAELLARNASPGGSADLLSASLFLDSVTAR